LGDLERSNSDDLASLAVRLERLSSGEIAARDSVTSNNLAF